MKRILDLGCGTRDALQKLGLSVEDCEVIGIDIVPQRVQQARKEYGTSCRVYICARGEDIPLASGSMDGAVCWLSLPYMNIPCALAELHRVLAPGGWLRATLHPPRFTWGEFRQSFPKPKQSLFRVFVLLNGMVLHCSGSVMSVWNVQESCQTKRGMRIALRRAGFQETKLWHDDSGKFHMEAWKEQRAA